jgi:hypothetical protein
MRWSKCLLQECLPINCWLKLTALNAEQQQFAMAASQDISHEANPFINPQQMQQQQPPQEPMQPPMQQSFEPPMQ